ncbi:AraC family transcriptional regulator [Hydrogenophaga sp.]|uniref:helix-turn-helix transcriptional regulator n=1 Tax=Hydrogenophaga sp. TaxID=1904254 RepID=UPI003D0B04FF
MTRSARDHLSVRNYGASHGSHDHGHFQILVGLDGVLELEVVGRGRRIAAGDGCVVPPGERHDFEARSGACCLVLDSHAEDWVHVVPCSPPPAALALARYLARACGADLPRAQQLGPGLLLEAWSTPPGSAAAPRRPRRSVDWSALARWALDQGPRATVADLANRAHLSAAQLAARCRDEHGQSTQQWLRDLRLAKARTLRTQGLSVADIAHRIGYRSPSALTAALRRRAG